MTARGDLLAEAEVSEFGYHLPSSLDQQDVRGLEISVNCIT